MDHKQHLCYLLYRGEVRYKPAVDYIATEPWNITMNVNWKIDNFNPTQVKLAVRNITDKDSTFVINPYDQDRELKDDKIAKVRLTVHTVNFTQYSASQYSARRGQISID